MKFSGKRGISSRIAAFVTLFALVCMPAQAAENAKNTLRIGVLQFGTVAWTLDTLKHQGFDKAGGFEVEVVPMAAPNAAQIALQGGAVDMITTDWLWVNRNRADGRKVKKTQKGDRDGVAARLILEQFLGGDRSRFFALPDPS